MRSAARCGRARATISLTVDVRHAGLEGDHTVPLHPRERTYACLTCGALQSCALAAPGSCPFLALRVVHSTASVRDASPSPSHQMPRSRAARPRSAAPRSAALQCMSKVVDALQPAIAWCVSTLAMVNNVIMLTWFTCVLHAAYLSNSVVKDIVPRAILALLSALFGAEHGADIDMVKVIRSMVPRHTRVVKYGGLMVLLVAVAVFSLCALALATLIASALELMTSLERKCTLAMLPQVLSVIAVSVLRCCGASRRVAISLVFAVKFAAKLSEQCLLLAHLLRHVIDAVPEIKPWISMMFKRMLQASTRFCCACCSLMLLLHVSGMLTRNEPEEVGVIVNRVVDGDTFRVDFPRTARRTGTSSRTDSCHDSFPEALVHDVPVRIAGIDAPELRSNCEAEKVLAEKAKRALEGMIWSGHNITLQPPVRRDKYFRLLAKVHVDGMDVGTRLVRAGLAVEYTGAGARRQWCDQSGRVVLS